ncbi:MAG: limonene-1,2-epoxide hydrolase family protein [Stenotrophobium sp.]
MTKIRSKAPATVTLAPEDVVTQFLHAIEAKNHARIAALLAPDLSYINVSLPTLKSGPRVARLFEFALEHGVGFEVQIHRIATNGDIVMTERTDMLKLGPLHLRFWVCGTFRVERGRIVLWRDYFDWWNISRGAVHGIAGLVLPRLRAALPMEIES